MPRYILIDNNSGYIFGDTADLDLHGHDDQEITPTLAARLLDESIGEHGRTYAEAGAGYMPAHNENAYHVYRADVGGSDAVAAVKDGQDQETIDSVTRDCEKVAVVIANRSVA